MRGRTRLGVCLALDCFLDEPHGRRRHCLLHRRSGHGREGRPGLLLQARVVMLLPHALIIAIIINDSQARSNASLGPPARRKEQGLQDGLCLLLQSIHVVPTAVRAIILQKPKKSESKEVSLKVRHKHFSGAL